MKVVETKREMVTRVGGSALIVGVSMHAQVAGQLSHRVVVFGKPVDGWRDKDGACSPNDGWLVIGSSLEYWSARVIAGEFHESRFHVLGGGKTAAWWPTYAC